METNQDMETRFKEIEASLKYSPMFVPWSMSRNYKPEPKLEDYSLNWKIKIERNGECLITDYSQGIGHIKGYKKPRNPYVILNVKAIQAAVEHRDALHPVDGFLKINRGRKTPPPPIKDVLYSLALDSDCIDYSFEDWAANYGYDSDSRKAESIYRECQSIANKMQRMFSADEIEFLREYFQDY